MAQVKFMSGDGVEHEVEESSMAAEVMRNAGFQQLGVETGEEQADDGPQLAKMTKKQLFDEAALRSVPVTEKMSKAEIIAAIESKE